MTLTSISSLVISFNLNFLGFAYDKKWLLLIKLHSDHVMQKGYSSLVSFTVPDINQTVTKLMTLGAELDGPIKYEIHGKVMAAIFPSTHFSCLGCYGGCKPINSMTMFSGCCPAMYRRTHVRPL